MYAARGRRSNASATKRGPLHAKAFVIGPSRRVPAEEDNRIVVMGSTNWTISSESNVELGVAMQIGKEGAAGVDHVVRDLRHNATIVTYVEMLECSAAQVEGGAQSRPAAEVSGSRGHRGYGVSHARPLPPQRSQNPRP